MKSAANVINVAKFMRRLGMTIGIVNNRLYAISTWMRVANHFQPLILNISFTLCLAAAYSSPSGISITFSSKTCLKL